MTLGPAPPKPSTAHPAPSASDVDLAELLQYLEDGGRMGEAKLETSAGVARIWFREGRLVDAELGGSTGEGAIERMLSARTYSYAIEYRAIARFPAIHDSALALLGHKPRRSAEWQRLVAAMPPLETVLIVNSLRMQREAGSLSGADRELLGLVDGRRTLVDIVGDADLDAVTAMQRLTWYFTSGLVRPRRGSEPLLIPIDEDDEVAVPSIRPAPTIPVGNQTAKRPRTPPPRRLTSAGIGVRAPQSSSGSLPLPLVPPRPSPRPGAVAAVALVPKLQSDAPPHSDARPSPSNRIEDALVAPRLADPFEPPSGEAPRLGSEPALEPEEPASLPDAVGALGIDEQGGPTAERVLLGRYEVLCRIARGGMGTVYLCRASGEGGFRRLFTLKVLRGKLAQSPTAARRFLEEARIAARIYHPHVVGIVDVGSHQGEPFLVMDYVEGGSFHDLLARHSTERPPNLIVPIVLDALAGLHAVHTQEDDDGSPLGLVHCDVSPQNLLVGLDGTCRLSDFGIAKVREAADVRHRERLGKPAYVSPEQAEGTSLDARSDIFSMGVVLWTALTGERLFEAESVEGTLANLRSRTVPAPSKVGLRPPVAFDAICLRALQRDPDERYPSAQAMLEELRTVAFAEGLLAPVTDVADWVRATFGEEVHARRLGVLDASRRARSPGAVTRSLHDVERPSDPPDSGRAEVNLQPKQGPRSSPPPSRNTPERTVATLGSQGERTSTEDASLPVTVVLPPPRQARRVVAVAAAASVVAIAIALVWPEWVVSLFSVESDSRTSGAGDPADLPPQKRGQP